MMSNNINSYAHTGIKNPSSNDPNARDEDFKEAVRKKIGTPTDANKANAFAHSSDVTNTSSSDKNGLDESFKEAKRRLANSATVVGTNGHK